MTPTRVYLDYNAGAPLRPEARAAMIAALGAAGNASSVHSEGRLARGRVEAARASVAALVGADPRRVTFTSGGSEANATVLTPDFAEGGRPLRIDRLLVGATEHPSVLAGGRFTADAVETIPVDTEGRIDLVALALRLGTLRDAGQRAMVSVMLANNETGTINSVAAVTELARRHGAITHSDAAQAGGRIPVAVAALGADFLTLSAHKIGGPQGAGAIVARSEDIVPRPLVTGGRQERGARAGTENVAAIAGFAAAADAARRGLATVPPIWRGWRDRLLADLGAATPGLVAFSAAADRLPQTLAVAVPGIPAETLVIGLDLEGISLSSGAACSSGKVGPSHVLAAMGVPNSVARGAVRVSFGWETTENDLDMFQIAWKRVVGRIRAAQGKAA
ncbi:MAG: cysteine desulfurase [Bauldia sp.]|nr:cysteine desulfurase [Bauldia sp.]